VRAQLCAGRRVLLKERTRLLEALTDAQPRDERRALRAALQQTRAKRQAQRTGVHLVEPKSSRSKRSLALPALTVAGLRGHRVRQLQARLVAGADCQDQGVVFTTPVGTPLDQSNVSKQFKHLLDTAGLRSMRIHDLRHSCATLLLAQGVDARTIMETLGHSQVSLTLNTYSHVLPTLPAGGRGADGQSARVGCQPTRPSHR
jgi:integrase